MKTPLNVEDVWQILDDSIKVIRLLADSAPEVLVLDPEEEVPSSAHRVICPHCNDYPVNGWIDLEVDVRQFVGETADDVPLEAEPQIVFHSGGDGEAKILGYACGDCEQLVNFPSHAVHVQF